MAKLEEKPIIGRDATLVIKAMSDLHDLLRKSDCSIGEIEERLLDYEDGHGSVGLSMLVCALAAFRVERVLSEIDGKARTHKLVPLISRIEREWTRLCRTNRSPTRNR